MLKYVIRRLLMLIPVLFGISVIVFSILHLVPGDPAEIVAGVEATKEDIELIRRNLGLDQPLHVQYLTWLSKVLQGDLGRSILTRRPVLSELLPRMMATVELTVASMIVAVSLGVTIGIISSTKQYSFFDHASMISAFLGVSMPVFWWGLMLMLLFSVTLGWLPTVGRGGIEHLILPSVTLATASIALIARMTRSSMLEVIRQDYIRTARAKGCHERRVIYKHALKNALIPVVTVVGLQFGYLLGGAVLTETVFAWPGIGRLMVDSIFHRDFPMVQGAILLVATAFVFVNLLTDILYAYLDPRIHY